MSGKQPGQVHGVGNPGVHAVTGIGHPDMRRIAGDKGATIAKLVRDQTAPIPILPGDDLVFEVGPDAEDGPDTGVAVHRIEIALAGLHVIVHQPSLAAIDRIHHAGAAGIDGAGAPGGLVVLTAEEVGSTEIGRLHALHDGVAG
jgi:hypothetical protein